MALYRQYIGKNGVITVTGNGQYLVFQLDNVVPGTNVRLETQNQVPTQCNPNPPPPGGPPNNTVLSGVFLSNCKPTPQCSIGDYVWEDADRDGCQGPMSAVLTMSSWSSYEDCTYETRIAQTRTKTTTLPIRMVSTSLTTSIAVKDYGIRFVNRPTTFTYKRMPTAVRQMVKTTTPKTVTAKQRQGVRDCRHRF